MENADLNALQSEISARIFAALQSAEKVPYTDSGFVLLKNEFEKIWSPELQAQVECAWANRFRRWRQRDARRVRRARRRRRGW